MPTRIDIRRTAGGLRLLVPACGRPPRQIRLTYAQAHDLITAIRAGRLRALGAGDATSGVAASPPALAEACGWLHLREPDLAALGDALRARMPDRMTPLPTPPKGAEDRQARDSRPAGAPAVRSRAAGPCGSRRRTRRRRGARTFAGPGRSRCVSRGGGGAGGLGLPVPGDARRSGAHGCRRGVGQGLMGDASGASRDAGEAWLLEGLRDADSGFGAADAVRALGGTTPETAAAGRANRPAGRQQRDRRRAEDKRQWLAGEWRYQVLARCRRRKEQARLVALLEDNLTGTESELPPWIDDSVRNILAYAERQPPDVNPAVPPRVLYHHLAAQWRRSQETTG
ncbi:hypothetical protein ACFXPA_48590 [Amycolatopsis sp. NPDC059090]|uniref:hypothetical protein n=1 Tax=Amycolatopsis sp. NPDC059090 TaxID=3346723 RepID=UPI0036717CD8